MIQTTSPRIIKPYILRFCKTIIPNQQPFHVPVKLLLNEPINECFSIVPKHITTNGGEQIFGWTIWEWQRVLMEAVFHTIWHTEDGSFIDISPKDITTDQILFLPDPRHKYEGRQVDNIRQSLTHDKLIHELCRLQHKLFLATNEGDLACKKEVPYTPHIAKIENEMEQLYIDISRKYGK